MQLSRLRISAVRQFREPLEITDFQAGLNIFAGPNESGKSTIVRAIRAAFLERHRSSTVDDLRPWDDSTAAPSIELDFTIGTNRYRLRKSFLHKKSCDLEIAGQKLESNEAEDRLATELGFQLALRGASKPELWGIPGLLWIEQGNGQEISEAVGHATDYLRGALQDSLGEMASSMGDSVLKHIVSERAKLLTITGKPTGVLAQAIQERDSTQSRLDTLQASITQYRQQVDHLGGLREQLVLTEQDRPWKSYRAKLQEAETQYAQVQQLEQQHQQERRNLMSHERQVELLSREINGFTEQEDRLKERAAAMQKAQEQCDSVNARLTPLLQQQEAADLVYQEALEHTRQARQQAQRFHLEKDIQHKQQQLQTLSKSLLAAEGVTAKITDLQQHSKASVMSSDDLKTLQKQDKKLQELLVRQQSIATRLRFTLEPDATIHLDGEILSGKGERLLTHPATLELPQIGSLHIQPGGGDLVTLQREYQTLNDTQCSLLQKLGTSSLDSAEALYLQQQRYQQDIKNAEDLLAIHAPEGINVLLSQKQTVEMDIAHTTDQLAAMPIGAESLILDPALAEEQQEGALQHLQRITRDLNQSQEARIKAQAEYTAAEREFRTLQEAVQDPQYAQRRKASQQELLQKIAERDAFTQRVQDLQMRITAAQPDILQQDIERWRRSAENAEKQFQQLRDQILQLETRLESAGAEGLEEQCAETTAQLEQLTRRHGELYRRAQALELLQKLLQEQRQALIQRLQAPLQKHLQHYLRIWYPQARLSLDDALQPGALTRPGLAGQEENPFDALSFGAREQIGVISRLAYADLLREAGRPTLLILDDVLVHSDAQRLREMKRILFDAAQRHQILLFTCHPENWQDLGVTPRSMDALRLA
ncbi:MAG: AAA family ATPase [Acidithiobacillus ferriphilus]